METTTNNRDSNSNRNDEENGEGDDMYVIKRDGVKEIVSFDKILQRIKRLGQKSFAQNSSPQKSCDQNSFDQKSFDQNSFETLTLPSIEFDIKLNYTALVMKVIDQLFDGISTTKIDELSADQCASLASVHPDYNTLAGRIIVSNHHKNTSDSFSGVMRRLYEYVDVQGKRSPLVSEEFYNNMMANAAHLDKLCDYRRDYLIDFFGFKTLERAYLIKINKTVVERPQHMWLRVAVGIHGLDLKKIEETYFYMSMKYMTHATPTLFNAGTPHPQLSSCFLLAMESDSLEGIYDTLKDCARISKWSGGIGLHIHNVRAAGSQIRGTNGTSTGIVPMLRVFNNTAKYVDQGSKRNGSFAIYLEPWHADIEMFLQMRKNHGDEELKARDLFYALWIPDLFMERVKAGGKWTLMCPDECPGLSDVWGEKFVELYTKYENEGKGRKTVNARDVWFQVLDAQMETGTPYLLYKDACNRKSNQQNLGTIKSSNLCSEILQYSDPNETAVCNLASIALPSCVNMSTNTPTYDFAQLHKIARLATFNLNRVIDINFYPTEKTKTSNFRHRPIGIGVQGLADVFMMMGMSFVSEEARKLNRDIFETIYHGALTESCEISKTDGPYESFHTSPASRGVLQFDMWNVEPGSSRYDWSAMKSDIMENGLRNSLLLAPMPTASTSQILGYNECIEPITSNIYSRRTLAGEFIMANKYLMNDLIKLDLWNERVKNSIIANNGSIQHIDIIPADIKERFKTVWEISMRAVIDMAADRGAFVCQSQSLNLWVEDPNYNNLTSMHFYGWSKGLKTGIYYLRRRGKHKAQQFTIEPEKNVQHNDEHEICESCSA